MISRVEYSKHQDRGEPMLLVVFTYDDEISDAYEVYGGSDINTIMGWLTMAPDPVGLLLEIRNLMKITVH